MAEESLRVCQLEEIPCPREFVSQIESRNIPAVIRRRTRKPFLSFVVFLFDYFGFLFGFFFWAKKVFKGCVKNWKAFSLWDPSSGGLDYLLVT